MVLNFGEVQVKKVTEIGLESPFGTHDTLRKGFYSAAHNLAPKHVLQQSLASVLFFCKLMTISLTFAD